MTERKPRTIGEARLALIDGEGNVLQAAEGASARELARTYLAGGTRKGSKLDDSRTVADYTAKQIGAQLQEHFMLLSLDARMRLISSQVVHVGTCSEVAVSMRDIFRLALAANASAIILSHNHPSGDSAPSAEDLALTRRALFAGAIMGIKVLDHVIVTAGSDYTSVRETDETLFAEVAWLPGRCGS